MDRKAYIFLFILLFSANSLLFSQYIPKGISYQAVARDEKGLEIKYKDLQVRICILEGEAAGPIEYSELHNVSTDKFGLFNINIGQGSFLEGSVSEFTAINWGSGLHFIRIAIDFGLGYRNMGTTQFMAVPYALYAATAANAPASADAQQLSYNAETRILSLENGGTIDLSSLSADADSDPNNEIQTLSYSNGTLSLKRGDIVTNEVTININDADSDPLNEIQNLNISGHQLSLTKGGDGIKLPFDPDSDTTNELQSIRFADDKLTLTLDPSPSPVEVNLKKYLDNTDAQELSISGDSLAISGNSSRVPIDISKTNELQSLRLAGDILTLSGDPDPLPIDLSTVDNQTLSTSGYNLSIQNGNMVNIRPKIFAFRALSNLLLPPLALLSGQTTPLVFEEEFDSAGVYDTNIGEFKVPIGGEGLYHFDVFYKFKDGHSLQIWVNGTLYETIPSSNYPYTYSMLFYLMEGDRVKILLKNIDTSPIYPQPGVFSGYRIH